MALNTPLSTGTPNLLTMLKSAICDNLTIGTANDSLYKQRLADKQLWLAGEFDFPFLTRDWYVNVNAGARFNNFPVTATTDSGDTKTLDWNRPFSMEVLYASRFLKVLPGIDSREYNAFSSVNITNGVSSMVIQQMDPIMRYKAVSSTQFEVWPVPASNSTLKITGQCVLDNLVNPTDTADLDDELIVYSLAADILSKRKDASSQNMLAIAQKRVADLRMVYPVREEPCVIGGRIDAEERRVVPIIAAH